MDASLFVAQEAASVLPNKRLPDSEDFRRHKLHSSPILIVRYFWSNEINVIVIFMSLGATLLIL